MVHEKLFHSKDLEKLDFAEYVRGLLSELLRTYKAQQEGIAVHTHIEGARLGVDTAIPCGLILYESVSNASKHVFAPDSTGEVWIDLQPTPGKKYILSVRDTGVGLPEGFDWPTSKSLGLKLVTDLTKQLDGMIEVRSDRGTAKSWKSKWAP